MGQDAARANREAFREVQTKTDLASGPLAFLTTSQVLNTLPEAVSICDASGRVVSLNDAWVNLIGPSNRDAALDAEPAPPGEIRALRPDESPAQQDELAISLALKGHTVRQSEIILQLPSGRRLWLQTNADPIRDASGAVIGAIACSHDITELRVLEQRHAVQRAELEQKVQELEMIISSMTDGVLITDAEGRTILTNPAFDTMIGPDAARAPAETRFHDLHFRTWEGRPLTYEESPVPRALSGEQFSDETFLVTGHDGHDLFERVSGGPLLDADKNILGSVTLIRDVTHLQEADRRRNEFVSLIAHELRTPVTLIRGFSQLLLQSTSDSDVETRRRLGIIDRRSEQLSRLISELLDVTRMEIGELAVHTDSLEYRSLVATVGQDMSALRPGRKLDIRGPENIMIRGDSVRLQQVLINLIDNAFTHGPESTSVEITMRREGDVLVTRVSDEGLALPLEERERIFDKFYQIGDGRSGLHRGIGLGLYISRQIVEAHDGRIWVDDDEHSTFAFSLPLFKKE